MIGQSIAHYKITAKLGAGGMGEVYRATDSKLGRDVALKVLPEAFSADAQRMLRFQREAQVLASLNHPHIAAIYGFEEAAGVRALAMELVEGATLAERIAQGSMPLDESLPIAKQIAEALEYAHEKGIIHRDLKPANIKLTKDGSAKILDFGLAKALTDDVAAADISTSPTLSMAATRAGIILGTAAYMSPEQARGKPVDRRADIWAFGVVLYEMLVGRQMFLGETVTDVMAAVVRAEPDWTLLPPAVPTLIRKLLRRCLEKDPRKRLRDIGEARLLLEEPAEPPEASAIPATVGTPPRQIGWLPWSVAALLALTTAVALWRPARTADSAAPIRFSVAMPEKHQLVGGDWPVLAISPDGSKIVFVADAGSGPRLFLRRMNQMELTPLPGTDGGTTPFFSPDGQWVGFFAENKLKKIGIGNTLAIALADAPSNRGATWGKDDFIYYAPAFETGLSRIPAAGGTPEEVTRVDREHGERTHRWPATMPNGDIAFIAGLTNNPGNYDDATVCIYSPKDGKMRRLKARGAYVRYSPPGNMIVYRGGSLMGFTMDKLDLGEGGFPLLEGVAGESSSGAAYFDTAQNGTLAFIPGNALRNELIFSLVDRKGTATPIPLRPNRFSQPRFAPDGKHLTYVIGGLGAAAEVWTYDLQTQSTLRLTFGNQGGVHPVWSPDGKKVVYTSQASGAQGLFWKMADGSGTEQQLYKSNDVILPTDWSRDGKWVAVTEYPDRGTFAVSVSDGKKVPIENKAYEASFSPDGRWVAYSLVDIPGHDQIYVRAFPEGGKWQISTDDGSTPRWSRDGKELFYIKGDKVMVVDVTGTPTFRASQPRVLFTSSFLNIFPLANYDVGPDGRFVFVQSPNAKATGNVEVVVHWDTEVQNLAGKSKK